MFGWNRRSTSQPEEPNMLGLISILGCENPHRRGDLIFVHGLAGHAWSTWHPQDQQDREDSHFWPAWLGEELKEKNLDVGIWSFGYEAARFQFSGSAMARFDQASNLLEYLEVNDIGERPIIFITHSMGGLLVKEMIHTAQNFKKQKVIQQIKGIVFLSTPHTGSHLAKLVDNIGILVRPTVNVEELKAHAPELRNLNEWYRQNVENLGIDTKVFYETKPLSGILVVDQDSANPGIKDVKPVAMPEDHNSIAKPSSKNNLVYLGVRKFVIEHLKPLPQLSPANSMSLEISSSGENQKPLKETANIQSIFHQPNWKVQGDVFQAQHDVVLGSRDINPKSNTALVQVFANVMEHINLLPSEEQVLIMRIVEEAGIQADKIQQGDNNPKIQNALEKHLKSLLTMIPDIGEVAITTLASPSTDIASEIQNIAKRVQGESKGKSEL